MTADRLETLLQDERRRVEARDLLRAELDAKPTTLTYMKWGKSLPADSEGQKVTFISSFTTRTLEPFLQAESFLADWAIDAEFLEYGLWQEHLFNPQQHLTDETRACVLLLHVEALTAGDNPRDPAVVDRVRQDVLSAIAAFRKQTSLPLFVGIVDQPGGLSPLTFAASGQPGLGQQLHMAIASAFDASAQVHLMALNALDDLAGDGFYDRRGTQTNLSLISSAGLPVVARRIARAVGCLFKPRRKLMVLDLDNTLWGGVVGELDASGVAVGTDWPGSAYRAFQQELRALRDSGILLALCSKNNEADAREVFDTRSEMVLSWDDFAAVRVNWNDKASNIAEIAAELGLGLSSVVFADDSGIECALVREMLPEVCVVELAGQASGFGQLIDRTTSFDTLLLTDEDTKRAASYQSEKNRKDAQAQAGDMDSFLAGIGLQLDVFPVGPETVERAHQLINKTNQFNLSLERLDKTVVSAAVEDAGSMYLASLKDRFGDYGIIGVMHLDAGGADFELRNIVLSCRALGRRVEHALMAIVRQKAIDSGKQHIAARFAVGPRNAQVASFLEGAGFEAHSQDDTATDYRIELGPDALPMPDHVQMNVT